MSGVPDAAQLAERARELLLLGRPSDAEVQARGALAQDPHQLLASLVLVSALGVQGQGDHACQLARQLVGQWPNDLGCRLTLVEVLVEGAYEQESVDQARLLVELAPDQPAALLTAAHALAQFRQCQDEASDLVNRALALDPDDPRAHAIRAHMLLTRGRLRQASAVLLRTLAADPHNQRLQAGLAAVLAQRGRVGRALPAAAAALRDAPLDAKVVEVVGAVITLAMLRFLKQTFAFVCICALVVLFAPEYRAVTAGVGVGLTILYALWIRFSASTRTWIRHLWRRLHGPARTVPRRIMLLVVLVVLLGWGPLWAATFSALLWLLWAVIVVLVTGFQTYRRRTRIRPLR
ncbi:MAG: tetratricopeptide repeat protein [Phycicoccus sp.]|nr:tetratricopeptide repeat protein [Phycicoccus sp.]